MWILNSWQGNPYWTPWTPKTNVIRFFETSPRLPREACHIPGEQNFQYEHSHIRHTLTSQKWVSHFGKVRPIGGSYSNHVTSSWVHIVRFARCCCCWGLQNCRIWRYVNQEFVTLLPEALCCQKTVKITFQNTRVGTLIVATIYLQLIRNRYMFRSFTVFQCSHQHCVQPVASDVEVVGYL